LQWISEARSDLLLYYERRDDRSTGAHLKLPPLFVFQASLRKASILPRQLRTNVATQLFETKKKMFRGIQA
jgi:hypothetical protein